MRRRNLLAIGLGAYAAALIIQAPATLVDAAIQQATNGRLRLTQAQGTIWAGSGAIEIRDANDRNAIVREAAWSLLPESLWRGRLFSEIRLEGATRQFPVAVSWSRTDIGDAEIGLPAAVLALAEPRLKPLHLSGDVSLHTTNLSVGRAGMTGNLTLQWRGAGSTLSPVSPLGSYEIRLDGQGGTVQGLLRTLDGPLQLDGSGAWIIGRKPGLRVTARVPPEQREQLTPLLRLISVQRDEGSFELQLN